MVIRGLAAVVLAFAVGVFVVRHAFGEYPFSRTGNPIFCDHLAYYTAGRLVRDGRAGELYDHVAVAEYQAGLFPGRWEALEAFRNPPFAALPHAVTARWSFVANGWGWMLLGLVAYLGGLRLLVGRAVPDTSLSHVGHSPTYRIPYFAVATVPAVLCFGYGQTSLLHTGVLAAVGWLLIDRRPFFAGLVAGLLWAKPPLLLGLVVWGVLDLRRLWPSAVGCVLTGALLTVSSAGIVPEAWVAFVGSLGANAQFDDFEWWKAPGPRAFWRLLLGPGPAATALWLLSAAAGLLGFVLVWRANRQDVPVVFAAAVLLTLWASPHAMIYEWSLIAVPGVLLADRRPLWRPFAVAWAALAVGTEIGGSQAWAWGMPVVQVATPALAWAGWRVVRHLTTP